MLISFTKTALHIVLWKAQTSDWRSLIHCIIYLNKKHQLSYYISLFTHVCVCTYTFILYIYSATLNWKQIQQWTNYFTTFRVSCSWLWGTRGNEVVLPQFFSLSLPFASFSSYTDPVQCQYLQRNPPCISLHQEGYLLPTASHPQEAADGSIPRRKEKDLGLITLQLSAENRFSITHLSYHNIPKSLTSCTLNGKSGALF